MLDHEHVSSKLTCVFAAYTCMQFVSIIRVFFCKLYKQNRKMHSLENAGFRCYWYFFFLLIEATLMANHKYKSTMLQGKRTHHTLITSHLYIASFPIVTFSIYSIKSSAPTSRAGLFIHLCTHFFC